jgi:hypothetical protein
MRIRRAASAIALLAAILTAGAIVVLTRLPATTTPSQPRLARPTELTAAERRYGLAPRRDASVVYQPDVVIVQGGANAVRSLSGDGLTWTLDPQAGNAAALAPGKILFVTGGGVGRVLGVRRTTEGLAVTVGPVELTDVIRDARISLKQQVNLDDIIVTVAPEFPGADNVQVISRGTVARGTGAAIFRPVSAMFRPVDDGLSATPRYRRIAAPRKHRFTVTPYAGSTGVGLIMVSDANGVRIEGEVVINLKLPEVAFDLDIRNGRVITAGIHLDGAAGFMLRMEIGSAVGAEGTINEEVEIPVDFSIPIRDIAVPFALTVRQHFTMKTAFSAKASVYGRGAFDLDGGFRMGYAKGAFGITGPGGFKVRESLLHSIGGISLGPAGMVLAHDMKAIIGIGKFGFVTGPYVDFRTSVGFTNGSTIGLVVCRGATIDLSLGGGVGYAIPQAVTNAINFFLRALNFGEIKGHGGFEAGRVPLLNRSDLTPKLKICGA